MYRIVCTLKVQNAGARKKQLQWHNGYAVSMYTWETKKKTHSMLGIIGFTFTKYVHN